MSLFLRKQVTWKFSFIKWKFPGWILTYSMLNKVAIDCRYSMYWWIVENTVHLWYHGKKVCFCCFQRLLSWIASFADFCQPFTYCGDGLIMRIPFLKQNQTKKRELNFASNIIRCIVLTNSPSCWLSTFWSKLSCQKYVNSLLNNRH